MNEPKKRKILVAIIVVSVLINFWIISFPTLATTKSIALWIADAIGYAGIVMLLWMYILGAKSTMSLFSKDLAPVLKIHKWLGKYGSLAIVLHPLLIVFSYGESLLYTIIPQLGSEFERHVTLGRISFLIIILVWVTSAVLRDKIKFRPWKYLHYLAYISLPFALLHVPDVGSHYESSQIVKLYFFALATVFLIFALVRLRGFLNLDKSRYKVVKHQQLTSTDRLLIFSPLDEKLISPKIGQYIYLKLGLISEDHPFSVLDYNAKNGNIAVCYRVFGSFTELLTDVRVGSTVWIGGPYGSFMSDYSINNEPTVFISGGIGITPFLMPANQPDNRERWLFAANRNHESAILVDYVDTSKTNLVKVFSRERKEHLAAGEELGYIDSNLITRYLSDPSKYRFYVCGPVAMVESVRQVLESLNVPESQIENESFGW